MKKANYSPSIFNTYLNAIIHETDQTKKTSKIASVHEWLDWHKKEKTISSREYDLACSQLEPEQRSLLHHPNTILSIALLSCILSFSALVVMLQNNYKSNTINKDSPALVTIPFTGVLKTVDGTPVDSKRDVSFRLYSSELGTQPVYRGECIGEKGLTPEYDGSFTIVLGSDCGMVPITQELLDTYESLYLGVQVGTDAEIAPRTLISTGAHPSVGSIAETIPESDPKGGDIMLQPAIGANTLITNGKVGIGTLEPPHKLSVLGIEPYESIMSVVNISPEDISTSSVLDLALGAARDGSNATFVNFMAGASREAPGSNVGRIHLGNGGVVYETKGADFAEYFDTKNNDVFTDDMIVGINTDGIVPATRADRIIGVTTGTPGFVGNSKNSERETSILVGLVGQVTVLVSTENGPIHMGDSISVGTIPGYGVKSISNSSDTIGIALENGEDGAFTQKACPYMYYIREEEDREHLTCGKIRILLDVAR